MATAVALTSILRARFFNQRVNQTGLNVKFLNISALGVSPVTLEDIGETLSLGYSGFMTGWMTNDAAYSGLALDLLLPDLSLVYTYLTILGANPGTAGGQPLPMQTSGLISLYSAHAGRSSRGRVYCPFPDQSWQTVAGEDPTPVAAAALTSIGGYFTNPVAVTKGGRTGTVNFGNPQATPGTFWTFTRAVGRQKWATQRRRGDYGRPNFPGPS